jgi:hypothetical protein
MWEGDDEADGFSFQMWRFGGVPLQSLTTRPRRSQDDTNAVNIGAVMLQSPKHESLTWFDHVESMLMSKISIDCRSTAPSSY